MWWKLVLGYVLVLLSAPQLFFWPIALGTIGVMLMFSAVLEVNGRRTTEPRVIVDKPPMSLSAQLAVSVAVLTAVGLFVFYVVLPYQP